MNEKREARNNYDFFGLALGLKDINQRAFRWLQLSLGVETSAHLCGDPGRVSVARLRLQCEPQELAHSRWSPVSLRTWFSATRSRRQTSSQTESSVS